MEKLRLKNSNEIQIEEGARLGLIIHMSETEEDALAVCQQITAENVESVEFLHDDEVIGSYAGLTIARPATRLLVNEGIQVSFGLREKTAVELDLEQLHAEQELQNEAIDFLAMGGI